MGRTDAGLYRFDGARFLSAHNLGIGSLANRSVRVLHSARNGAFWAGFGEDGGISTSAERKYARTDDRDGLPRAAVTAIVEHGGTIWAATEQGLYTLVHERWRRMGREAGLPMA